MKRLIIFIVIFGIFLTFIVLNMENKCNISFGFVILPDIPIFLSLLCSFALGMLITIPFVFRPRKDKKKPPLPKTKKPELDGLNDEIAKGNSPYGID
jgi:uncharacterized integral membrane protein